MDIFKYSSLWTRLQPLMLERMQALHAKLSGGVLPARYQLEAVTSETNTEDFFVSLMVVTKHGNQPILAINFKLHDEDLGAAVSLVVDNVQSQTTEWAYRPENFNPFAITLDGDVLAERVKEAPLDGAAAAVLSRLNGDVPAQPA